MNASPRLCAECSSALPAAATRRRKFCTPTCRRRHHERAKRRHESTSTSQQLVTQLAAVRAQLARKESLLADARTTIAAARSQLKRQEAKFRKRERRQQAHAERAIVSRIATLASARERLTAVTGQLDSTTPDPDRSSARAADQEITDLQARLATVTDRLHMVTAQNEELRDRCEELRSAHNRAAKRLNDLGRDRQRIRPILEAWDTLAGRLARSASPANLSPADREIVRTWAAWTAGRDQRDKAGQ